jgi:peptide-methionine (S)-S-oxide reductase
MVPPESDSIVLGGGCFWCTEAAFKLVPGVIDVKPGYAGGTLKNPTYEDVCTGETGHVEVIKVTFDPSKVSLAKLLDVFFHAHDPTTKDRQGHDAGTQYRSIILYADGKQEAAAEKAVKKEQETWGSVPVVTEVKKLDEFYPAEKYHEDFYKKNPFHPYCLLIVRPKVDKVRKYLESEGKA